MERKSGFKECPRCGLRNKPSSVQCDFCGWEFQDTSDEWISHIQILEKLNKQTESILLDDEVSKRIEATIDRSSREVQPAPPPVPQAAPQPIPQPVVEQPPDAELKAKGKEWSSSHMQTPTLPSPEAKEVKAFVETMIGEPARDEDTASIEISDSSTIGMATAPLSPVEELGEAPSVSRFLTKTFMVSNGTIILGTSIYLVTLMMFVLSMIPLLIGWSLAIVGAILITIGVSFAYDRSAFKRRRSDSDSRHIPIEKEKVVLICPSCNEEVGARDKRCPACGAKFA